MRLEALVAIYLLRQGEGDNNASHDVVEFEISFWAKWVLIMTVDAGLRDSFVSINSLKIG